MRRLLLFGLALVPLVLFGFATDAAAGEENHGKVHLETVLAGANERPTPATGSDLTGEASVVIDLRTHVLCWKLDYDTAETVIASHIHHGGAGVAGPVIFGFFNPPPSATVVNEGCRAGDPALLADIAANPANYYVNVHTTKFPGGAGRGQLSRESDD
jgi:CHRD domain